MRNKTFSSFLSWLLIASPLWWTSGCYTFREVTKLDEPEENERQIEVTTRGNSIYIFNEWSFDSLGAMRGKAKWANPSYKARHNWFEPEDFGGEPKFLEGPRFVPIDSVATIKAQYFDAGMTVLAGLGIVAAIASVFLLLGYAIMSQSRTAITF